MPDESFTIFVTYMTIYCCAFVITSIYCAYCTIAIKSQSQGQSASSAVVGSCLTCDAFKQWIKLTWSFKNLYLSIIPHIFDQATDIAVIYEYYSLINDKNIENVIDTSYLFWMSIVLFLFARITSTIAIYKLTKNKYDILLGLLDLIMVKAIYVGYLLKRESPTNIQRYIGLLEATLEAFPQLLISTFFITTVVAYNDNNIELNPFIPISLLFSLYSLTSRVTSDDKSIYNADWKNLECKPSCKKFTKCKCINFKYLLRVLMRFMEISSRLILYVLLWINFGGLATGIILSIEFICLLTLSIYGGSVEIIGNMMYFVLAGDLKSSWILSFLFYRFISSYVYLTIITVFSNVKFNTPEIPSYYQRREETIDSKFGLVLAIYCWIAHFIWPCVGTYIAFEYANRDTSTIYVQRTGLKDTTRSLDIMRMLGDGDGLVDMITFGVSLDSIKDDDITGCVLMYYSMLHAVDDNNKYILDNNTRDYANQLMIKYGLDKTIDAKTDSDISCAGWNPGTKLSKCGGGYLLMKSNSIIINCHIELASLGYFGSNEYNNTKSKIENKQLKGKLYHGHAHFGYSGSNINPRGGATLILHSDTTITFEDNAYVDVGNGNILICCKKLIMPDKKEDEIIISIDQDIVNMAIYCDELKWPIPEWIEEEDIYFEKRFYRGSYEEGVNILKQRT